MLSQFDKTPYFVMRACLEYVRQGAIFETARRDGTVHDMLYEGLVHSLKGQAEAMAGQYSGWRADQNFPGYMVKFDAPVVVRAPVHLVPVMPDREILNKIWDLSRVVRTTATSVICLSGSNAVRRVVSVVGDIDFCEYVYDLDTDTPNSIDKKFDLSDCRLLSLRLGDFSEAIPWTLEKRRATQEVAAKLSPLDKIYSNGKFDYLAESGAFGIIETSNLVIICDDEGNSRSLDKTFAAQEAPLVTYDWIPNQFASVYATGSYIQWLMNTIKDLRLAKNYSKAMKRSISLARFCFQDDITSRISSLFESSSVLQQIEVNNIEKLIAKCQPEATLIDLIEKLNWGLKKKQLELNLLREKPGIITEQEFNKKAQAIIDDQMYDLGLS